VPADTVVSPDQAGFRDGGRPAGRAPRPRLHNGHGRQHRPHGRRNGVPDGVRGGRAHGLRHVQSRQSGHGHRARQALVQDGRKNRLPSKRRRRRLVPNDRIMNIKLPILLLCRGKAIVLGFFDE